MEAAAGVEPANKGFADLCLTTWLRRREIGAENGIRTRDLQLGKLLLYQLSYFRSLIYSPAIGDLLSRRAWHPTDVRPIGQHWANVFLQAFPGIVMTFALTSLGESHWKRISTALRLVMLCSSAATCAE